MAISGDVLLVSLAILDHLGPSISSIMVQVEAGDSKLLLSETFLLFLIILFFLLSRTSYRGARAPKNTLLPAPSLYSSTGIEPKVFFNHYKSPCSFKSTLKI